MKQSIHIQNLNIYICSEHMSMKSENQAKDKTKPICYPNEQAPDGVYITTVEGNCWMKDFFSESHEIARGVAVIRGKHQIVVHPNGSSEDIILLESYKRISGKTYDNIEDGLTDFDGMNNTDQLLKLGSQAAIYCKSIGHEWYLPTLGEMQLIFDNKLELDACLAVIGTPLYDGWHWTSTRFSECSNLVFDWSNGLRFYDYQVSSSRVRPVSASSLSSL